jgi:hypothetical protein
MNNIHSDSVTLQIHSKTMEAMFPEGNLTDRLLMGVLKFFENKVA